ncbi:RF-1 domain-containing protein [Singulisphaera sp. GP187]|uniref:peptide chain release factor-like protein n=1 Tax=Singulisphaera sp. GP187 TaxID=1882752 RepID=UPI00092CADDD|nr:peptide chain release factor-like protein [Singulisphaera sp. GP187]SIN89319.1 RF-1 domain-containing protein [Singulisphaera sp. GP187]
MSANRVHPASLDVTQLASQCETKRTRRSGPGGQNRNKVETTIVLLHRPTGIGAEASERRTQGENLRAAYFRLRVNLALEVRLPVDPDASPSPLWQSRCRAGRIAVSLEHEDFPSILAETLDVLAAQKMDVKLAAEALGCTPSQLTRFLKSEPRALELVNAHRRLAGLHLLR